LAHHTTPHHTTTWICYDWHVSRHELNPLYPCFRQLCTTFHWTHTQHFPNHTKGLCCRRKHDDHFFVFTTPTTTKQCTWRKWTLRRGGRRGIHPAIACFMAGGGFDCFCCYQMMFGQSRTALRQSDNRNGKDAEGKKRDTFGYLQNRNHRSQSISQPFLSFACCIAQHRTLPLTISQSLPNSILLISSSSVPTVTSQTLLPPSQCTPSDLSHLALALPYTVPRTQRYESQCDRNLNANDVLEI